MIPGSVTLRQLRYFDALAHHAHFGRAAAACAVSQPALSMQIKELEEALGAALVERGSRSVRLTAFGQEASLRVRDILHSIDRLGELAQLSQNRISGRLRIGMIPTIAPYLLPAVIGVIMREHPHVEIEVREALTSKLIEELAEGRLDIAIAALPVFEPSLAELALFTENFLLVRPAADAGKPVPSREMLREMRLLLLEEGHCFRNQALSFCNMPSASPRKALEANSFSTLVQMVRVGMGVTLVPEMAVEMETGSGSVSVVRFKDPQPSRTVGMIWRKTTPLDAQFRQLATLLAQPLDQHGAEV